jgi:long-chain acyl-CoA synthetase
MTSHQDLARGSPTNRPKGGPLVEAGRRARSADEIRSNAARAATGFRESGIGEGDTIALLLRNDFSFFEASIAANLAGAYPVPINWHATQEEVEFIVRDCGAKTLVAHLDLLPSIINGLPVGLPILVVPTPDEIRAAYQIAQTSLHEYSGQLWSDFVAACEPLETPSNAARSAVIYTSGTTGRPKGVKRLPMPATSGPVGAAAFGFDLDGPINVLMNGPMYHSAPNVYGMGAFQIGANIILQPRFDAEDMLELIQRYKITHMHVVPTMFVRLLKLPETIRARYDVSSLRFVIHGAAPCPPHVKRAMIEWWGPVIYEYYGSTETGLATFHGSDEALRKPGTVGRALPDAVVKIFDKYGHELGPDQEGEVYLRSGSLPDFTYIGLEEKRAEVGRGNLVTVGDIGKIDRDGYLFLCDRKRDMIISGGVNIYPAEIEAAILAMPGVRDCAVFGIPDDDFGESVCAYIEPLGGANIAIDLLRLHLEARLARYKLPKLTKFVCELPREDSGKIFKRKLREPYWAAQKTGSN